MLAWKPDIHPPVELPERDEGTSPSIGIKYGAFSGSHFRLRCWCACRKRVEPLPESEYSAPLRYQLADFAPRDNFVWVDRCYKMASSGRSRWRFLPTGASRRPAWRRTKSPAWTKPSGKAKPRSKIPLSIWSKLYGQRRYAGRLPITTFAMPTVSCLSPARRKR